VMEECTVWRDAPLHPDLRAWNGARVVEVPVRHHPRRYARPSMGFGRVPMCSSISFWFGFYGAIAPSPSHLFGKIGLLSILLSMAAFALAVHGKLTGQTDLLQASLPVVSVLLFLFGPLCILLGSHRRDDDAITTRQRPARPSWYGNLSGRRCQGGAASRCEPVACVESRER